jgi:phosphoglycerate dehydrogenase-like enzyme
MAPKVYMVGEAGNYRDKLAAGLTGAAAGLDIVTLPREAALGANFDDLIGSDDILISLRLKRNGGPLPPVRLLHVPGAGLDGIDMTALADQTIVCNVFEHQAPIAEFVVASLLEWELRLVDLRRSFTADSWSDVYRQRVPHGELRGKTVGVIGHGRIGRAIADLVRPFGVEILAVDAFPTEGVWPVSRLPELLAAADYVVIACPLTSETEGLIGAAELTTMKSTAVIVNVSRAPIIDEGALYEALTGDRIRGASLDVWYRYPTSADDRVTPSERPFLDLPNAICTPHCAAWTRELMDRRYAVIASNISALLNGEPLVHQVRP